MRHCRVDVVPSSVIRTPHKPDPIVSEEDDIALAVATKDHPLVAWTMPTFFPGDFGTVFRQRGAASLGDRQSLSRPSPFGDARMVAFDHVSRTSEFVQLAILTTAGRNREHQKRTAVLFNALQHREERWIEFQITHNGMASNGP